MLSELESLPGMACCKGIFSKSVTDKICICAFHDAVLAEGSVPLPVLEQRIGAFIGSQTN